jgi:hypothetical protein
MGDEYDFIRNRDPEAWNNSQLKTIREEEAKKLADIPKKEEVRRILTDLNYIKLTPNDIFIKDDIYYVIENVRGKVIANKKICDEISNNGTKCKLSDYATSGFLSTGKYGEVTIDLIKGDEVWSKKRDWKTRLFGKSAFKVTSADKGGRKSKKCKKSRKYKKSRKSKKCKKSTRRTRK